MQPNKFKIELEEQEIQRIAGILAEWVKFNGTNPNAVAEAGILISKLQHAQKLEIDKTS
jgi:hypothetical protein